MKGTLRKPRTAGGSWRYRIDTVVDDRGRRRQRQVGGFRTKKEAQAALNDARELMRPVPSGPEQLAR